MKIMKNLFALLSVILILGCPKLPKNLPVDDLANRDTFLKNVDSIEIEMLQVGLLEGLPSSLPNDGNIHTIEIDSITIKVDSQFTIDKNILKLKVIEKDTITVAIGSGKISRASPYHIGMLIFKKVNFIKEGKEFISFNKPIKIVKFNIDKYDFQYNASSPIIDKLSFKIKNLEPRILSLIEDVKLLVEEEPDHAARELPPTLSHLLRRVREIKEFYVNREHKFITESMRTDLNELNNIEYSVEAQEAEVRNPSNKPLVIENELLFATGQFDINKTSSKLDMIIKTINDKIRECETKYPGLPLRIALSVTGYADEQRIEIGNLETTLRGKYPQESIPYDINEKQEPLNRLLSQARADNVYLYIKDRVLLSTPITSSPFLTSGAIGKGWKYPVQVMPPCKDDCQQRRVVYISHIVFPLK